MGIASAVRHAAAAALLLSAPAHAQKLSRQDREAIAATPEQIAAKASIKGTDALDTALWVSTEPFNQQWGSDRFFRARIDKRSGEVTYQVYIRLVNGRGWIFPNRLSYEAADGVKETTLDRIGSDVSCSRYTCSHYEDAVAVLPRADIEHAAAGAVAGADNVWRAKVFGRTVDGFEMLTLRTEAAGFLLAVDRAIQEWGK